MKSGAPAHWLDRAFGRLVGQSSMFQDGWGDPEILRLLSEPPRTQPLDALDLRWDEPVTVGGLYRRTGTFTSPAAEILDAAETQRGHVELLLPRAAIVGDPRGRDLQLAAEVPVCLHLASSGEEGLMRRRVFSIPLVRRGLGALLLENPFYGRRRPPGQRAHLLRAVTDQLAMNRATVREASALLGHLAERGARHLGVSGYSMGGYMAALTVTRCPFPLAAIPCAAGLSPAPVFVEGVLSRSVAWQALTAHAGGEAAARDRLAAILNAVAGYLETSRKPKVAIIVAARGDAFVLPREAEALARAWPEAELRWVDGGHVTTYLRHQPAMRRAVADAFLRLGARLAPS